MPATASIEIDLPADWVRFKMPRALDERLSELLDKQDQDGKLTAKERREAEALVQLSDMLSVMKLRASFSRGRKKR